jgi:hypothetical protein
MVADGGDGVAATEIGKVRGFGGSDVLPGTRVDVFYQGLARKMRENMSKTRSSEKSFENFWRAQKDNIHAESHPKHVEIYILK